MTGRVWTLATAALLLASALTAIGVSSAFAEDSIPTFESEATSEGISTTLWTREAAQKEHLNLLKQAAQAGAKETPTYEYKTEHRCQDMGAGTVCNAAAAGPCPSAIEARNVLRRTVYPDGRTGAWEQVGIACNANEVPAARQPGMADILRAFHDTDFTAAALTFSPPGQRTLVNLPTYVAITWPAAGFHPEEVDSRTLPDFPDHPIEIKPTLASVTYHFGDGTTQGPTTSLGGSYPDGDVVHTYTRAASVDVRADTVYGGEFRLGHGEWLPIPDTVTIPGATATLHVLQARNQLVLE